MAEPRKVGDRDYLLDVRGYVCPYPQIYTSQALSRLPKGSLLRVLTDNPPSVENVQSVARRAGARVLSVQARDGEWEIAIER